MSWLRNTSLSFARQLSRSLDPRHDYEPQACYNSFCKHWQQAHDIIIKSQPRHLHDDVLGVVNHLEQLATLLVLEARAREINTDGSPASCLEYLLSENLLDKLFEWAICTGKYENAVRLEQLKLFGSLVSHYSTQVIAAEPFLRPLLKLLSSFRNQLPPPNLESQLVTVLNQICVALMQNMKFIDLFFLTTHTQNGSQAEFIIVRLLLSSVHREGRTGSAARDALLLCAKMSSKCSQLADFMLAGNTCPVLATGLSGLYSLLPRSLGEKIYRLTPDDVNQVHKLTLFIDSLEFCNAVAQVAHPSIKKHLLDLLYQGFLVPVLGPALLQPVYMVIGLFLMTTWLTTIRKLTICRQIPMGVFRQLHLRTSPLTRLGVSTIKAHIVTEHKTKPGPLQSGAGEQATAMIYLELLVRCVTERGLLRSVLHFLFVYEYDGIRIIDVLLRRLEGTSQLSLVSLSLMETLIDINCEDVTIDLIYKYLVNGHHLMATHRYKITDSEFYRDAAFAFLSLTPRCCQRPIEKTRQWVDDLAMSGRRVLDFRKEDDRKYNGVHEDIAMSNLVQEVKFNYGNPNETLYGNYHAYLCDARFEIVSRAIACRSWSSKYDSITTTPKRETNNNSTKETRELDSQNNTKEQDSLISICTSEYDTLKTSDTSEKEQHSLTSFTDNTEEAKVNENQNSDVSKGNDNISINHNEFKERDNVSIGESSDYESFKDNKTDEQSEGFAEDLFGKSIVRDENERDYEVPVMRSWRASAETIIGPLLSSLLKKVAVFLESEVVVNCRVTSVLSRLASLPTPLLTSLLLCPGFVLSPNVPSLFQILNTLKEEMDELTECLENIGELVDKARVYLIQRELALAKSRGPNNEDCKVQTQESPSHRAEDVPFRRAESKRRSFSSSFSSMFARKPSSSPSPSQHSSSPQHRTSPNKRPIFTQEAYWNQSITLRSVLNAVLFDEWLKELAALCEEHALRLSSEHYEDDTFIRTVAL